MTSSAGPSQTTIEGNINGAAGGGPDTAAVTFSSGESRSAVINGFTITTATFTGFSNSNGIYIFSSNPTISNNVITANTGNGIKFYYSGALISGNTISNTNTGYDATQGLNCDYNTGSGIAGGGVYNFDLEITGNTITNNVAPCEGGGIFLDGPPVTTIMNNIISNNQGLAQGGGIQMVNAAAFPISITQNLITGNYASQNGGGMNLTTPAIAIPNPVGPLNLLITSNTIAGNSIAPDSPISGYFNNGSQVALGGYVSQTGFFDNLIIANDKYAAIACDPSYQDLSLYPPVASYNDIYDLGGSELGGWCTTANGSNNISVDPKFNNAATGDYHLQTGSPAIDSGYNAAPGLSNTDFSGNPRVRNATGIASAIADMGCYEAPGTPNLRNSSTVAISVQPPATLYGQMVTLTAQVSAASGNVTFLDDWNLIGQAAVTSAGVASISTAQLSVGTHSLVAAFGGNSILDESASSAKSETVSGYPTSISLIGSLSTADYSQPVTFTATVTAGASGSVVFWNGELTLATVPVSAGTASLTTSTLSDGADAIYAVYSGDAGHSGSQSNTVSVTIQDFLAYVSGNAPPVFSIVPGQSGSVVLLENPYGGFTGEITLSCAVPAAMIGATCAAPPIQVTSIDNGSSALTVTTSASTQADYRHGTSGLHYATDWVLSACIFFAFLPWSASRRRYKAICLAGVTMLTLTLCSCSTSGSGTKTVTGTPAGTYTLTITASSGVITHSFTEGVVIQ